MTHTLRRARATWGGLLLALSLPALAQQVWRCGPEGRLYTDARCEGGRAVDVSDPRSAADVAEALIVARREQHLARQMVAERAQRHRDYRARGSGLTGVTPEPARVSEPVPTWEPVPWPRPPVRRRPAGAA